ncbi:FAD binding domain-containing protein [Psychrobacter pacificensis]|jgi:xanthine dehydrogenase small subunit|uniref:xanthine dehydrogenase small subunit n=1 Tax=Psychrobacter TaxID=497 RepID=UPI00257B9386|nr:FAD binding domain-containing protein [Psychrobacter sp. UBA2514]|tara:strand:+ start:20178 stop:21884 length:1707 start_codon:yes stop_codon:yes gene_type:complete
MISFYLNGKYHELTQLNPNTTVLEYLRLHEGQTDTKEGCGSGDCGACTVMAQRLPSTIQQTLNDENGNEKNATPPFYTINSCITLLSLMDGHHLMTASYLADNPEHHPERALLHPAQQAMVECHGSQCGFCTPGFVMSLACVYENNRMQTSSESASQSDAKQLSYDEVVASISGNLCRCTGYRPIIEAGLLMSEIGQKREAEQSVMKDLTISLATDAMGSTKESAVSANAPAEAESDNVESTAIAPALNDAGRRLYIPKSLDEFNQILAANPQATIWAGGTDLGLSVTQHLVDHEIIIQLSGIEALKSWALSDANSNTSTDEQTQSQSLVLGAGMSYQQMLPVLEQYFPRFAQVFERIASPQIRNMGTIGGNIANASPIGDLPPILLALDASIHLRHCAPNREESGKDLDSSDSVYTDEIIPLSAFFLDYKKTKLQAGSYIVAIHIPLMQDHQHLFIHKISKRYEDDISACLLAARLDVSADGAIIDNAKLGLGGMAAIPLLAVHCQQALIGQATDVASFEQAAQVLSADVTPMTDVRASREYRMHVVQRLLVKCGKQLVAEMQAESA